METLEAPVQLSPHLYVVLAEYPHRHSANVYLIAGAKPTLIDCGSEDGSPLLERNLAQIGFSLSDIAQVVATHGHYDHVQGIHALRRHHAHLPLLIHEGDWKLVQGNNPYQTAACVYGREFLPIPAEGCLALTDGQMIHAGDGELTVHHTPGHSEGSMCLSGSIDGVNGLFCGDTVFGSMNGLLGADVSIWTRALEHWRDSLRRVASLEFDHLLPGHEPAWGLPVARARLERALPHFGRMLNPWFGLGGDESTSSSEPALPQPSTIPKPVAT